MEFTMYNACTLLRLYKYVYSYCISAIAGSFLVPYSLTLNESIGDSGLALLTKGFIGCSELEELK